HEAVEAVLGPGDDARARSDAMFRRGAAERIHEIAVLGRPPQRGRVRGNLMEERRRPSHTGTSRSGDRCRAVRRRRPGRRRVAVGGKGEATIEIDELKDANGELDVAVGDRIQAMVVSTEEGLILSRKLARSAATSRQLEDAFRTGLPVEGRVERTVKGGYEVR